MPEKSEQSQSNSAELMGTFDRRVERRKQRRQFFRNAGGLSLGLVGGTLISACGGGSGISSMAQTAAPTDDADMPAASSSPTATARPVFARRRASLPRRCADLDSSGVRTERSLSFSGVGQELVLVLQSALPPDAAL